jgi:RND family efflux transporter MFP subunit
VNAGLRLEESRAAMARAEANLKLAESQNELSQTTAQRYAALLATGDVSRTVADQARTQAETSIQNVATARASVAEARAQLAMAEKAVTDVVVAAPFAGYIGQRHVSLGEYVQPSTAVVTLLKVNPLRLQLTIPGIQAGSISTGQNVTATVDAFPGKTFTGQITAVNPAISAESRSFLVEARVPNPDAMLKPGMFAVATIDQGRADRGRQHELVPRLHHRRQERRPHPRRAAGSAPAGGHGAHPVWHRAGRARRHLQPGGPLRRRTGHRQRHRHQVSRIQETAHPHRRKRPSHAETR